MVLFKPDFVIFSAGFDAHDEDPLADVELTEEDFIWATEIGDSHNIFYGDNEERESVCVFCVCACEAKSVMKRGNKCIYVFVLST